jgi:ABC-2 type transport system ATP-binding protein
VSAIRLQGVTKAYDGHVAVNDLELDIPLGGVFGLLGPNGAGKTTTLRMVMDIIAPDSGRIEILGRPADGAARDAIGYMPEERGLYPKMALDEQLLFLAEIKGVARRDAVARLAPWLERMGLAEWAKRKTNELSKGMQQKAQFIAAVLHEPQVLILDEPMSGLDPLGADLMRETLLDLSRQGKTLIVSSHQMETVERICDRVALIERGEKVLDGALSEVKAGHGGKTVALAYEGDGAFLSQLPGVRSVRDFGRYVELSLEAGTAPHELLPVIIERLNLTRFEVIEPSLHAIFVDTVATRRASAQGGRA